jgi:hypothetical protein
MEKIGLPHLLQDDIREYIHKTVTTRDKQEETDHFFDIIKPSLKVKVNNKLFEQNLMKNELIRNLIGEPEFDKEKKTVWSKIIRKLKEGKAKKSPNEDNWNDQIKLDPGYMAMDEIKDQSVIDFQLRKKKYRYFVMNVI